MRARTDETRTRTPSSRPERPTARRKAAIATERQLLVLAVLLFVCSVVYRPEVACGVRIVTEANSLETERHVCPSRGRLFFATHDFEHVDLFAVLKEISEGGASRRVGARTSIVVANMAHNRLLALQSRVRRIPVSFLYVQGGTVRRVLRELEAGGDVYLFLYRESASTGAYHIVRGFEGAIGCVRVLSREAEICRGNRALPCLRATYGKRFFVRHDTSSETGKHIRSLLASNAGEPRAFVRELKRVLYGCDECGPPRPSVRTGGAAHEDRDGAASRRKGRDRGEGAPTPSP